MALSGKLVLLVSPKGKRYLHRVKDEGSVHTHDGYITMETLAASEYGAVLNTHMNRPYRVLKPTLYDLVKGIKRQTQILYPKDIGYICMRLGIGPDRTVIEAGSGSGSMTMALSWFSGPTGHVYTYEARPEFAKLNARNLEWAGVGQNVTHHVKDIAEGFDQTNVDALFLDVRTPWDYLDHVAAAVAPGATMGFLLPVTNQVSELVDALDKGPFAGIEVLEILVRRWKPVPDRLRPDDRMVAHTGFLVFARQEDPSFKAVPAQVEAAAAPVEEAVVEATDPTTADESAEPASDTDGSEEMATNPNE